MIIFFIQILCLILPFFLMLIFESNTIYSCCNKNGNFIRPLMMSPILLLHPLAIAAIIFGIFSIRKAKNKSLPIIGMILSILLPAFLTYIGFMFVD